MFTTSKPTVTDKVLKAVGSRKRGITASEIASKTGANPSTVQRTLSSLRNDGLVRVLGTKLTGTVGRPPNVYASV